MTPAPITIGTPGIPWGEAEVAIWLSQQTIKRSYAADVLRPIDTLRSRYDVVQYGQLDHQPARYPLLAIKSRGWRDSLPCVLLTGACMAVRCTVQGYPSANGVSVSAQLNGTFASRDRG